MGGGGARTRERAARPRQASGTERGAGGGGATARTHSHTRAPTPPPAAPARGAARRPRGTVQPVGDCQQLQGRPRPSPPRPACGAPPARPRRRLQTPRLQAIASARASASPFPPEEKEKVRQRRGADLAWEAKRVSLVSLLPGSFPPPPSSAAWNRSGTRPVGPPPEPPRVTGSRPSRRGGPRRRSAELREVCHTSRGATGWHGNGAAAPRPLSGPDGRHALWGGLRRGGQRRGVSAYVL